MCRRRLCERITFVAGTDPVHAGGAASKPATSGTGQRSLGIPGARDATGAARASAAGRPIGTGRPTGVVCATGLALAAVSGFRGDDRRPEARTA
jgi:hypothetical protein